MTDAKTKECCACPSCGGLECLCRPRFFAGQLLTDETLNQLEHYIIEKNKLHNRFLHGWGVVCGLEVVCNPCNGVTVRGGYALSPCGEDIIVCKDVLVDVCSLINNCKDKRRDWECEPYAAGQISDCQDAEEDWILTVRYDEKTSRGITALKGSSAPAGCSSCSCGGSSACGCGCHGSNGHGSSQNYAYASSSAGTSRQSYKAATVAPQCEPTITCEGYVFEVCKPTPESTTDRINWTYFGTGNKNARSYGALVDRATVCIRNFLSTLPQEPAAGATSAAMYQWCCAMKQKLREDLFDHPVYNCQLAQALNFPCPDPTQFSDAAYRQEVDTLMKEVFAVFAAEYLQYCLCSSFLPPCPEEVCDPRVPLATITVKKDQNGTCRILRVCNLGKRRHVITFGNLGYWFSFILTPLMVVVRRLLERYCCRPLYRESNRAFVVAGKAEQPLNAQPLNAEQPLNVSTQPLNAEQPAASQPPQREVEAASFVTEKRGFKAFAGQVWANRVRTVGEETLFLGAIGATDARGMPYLSETELNNPFYTLTVNRIAGPLLAKLPDHALDSLKTAGTSFAAGAFSSKTAATMARSESSDSEDLGQLKTRMSDLQSTVEQQSRMIEELQRLVQKDK
jgi:hypothetical protein